VRLSLPDEEELEDDPIFLVLSFSLVLLGFFVVGITDKFKMLNI
jgi:hypothetical protein